MSGIKIEAIGSQIANLMEEYASDVTETMKEEAIGIANDAVKELRQTSPSGAGSRKGHYKDGWRASRDGESSTAIRIKVHNSKKPSLTHLLEKGHAKRGGGRVNGIPHIATAEQHAAEEYEKCLKERLSK